jgi:hypothetical protein
MYALGQKRKLGVMAEEMNISKDMAKIICDLYFKHTKLGGEARYHSSEYDVVVTWLVFQNARRQGLFN